MPAPSERGHVPGWLLLLVLALLLVIAALLFYGRRGAGYPAPPAPSFSGKLDTINRSTVLAYAQALAYDTIPGAGDEQRLMVGTTCPPWAPGGNCTYGPLVRIEPQAGAHAISDSNDLAAGRIVARIISADSAYPKLNLPAGGTVYWWVYKDGADWRSTFVSSDTGMVLIDMASYFHPPAGYRSTYVWRQAIARFNWKDSDEALWVTCTGSGCCKTHP
ncbi:MAG: hypothetical protein ACREMR_04165 [Gemmatimonadales bacterium]